jgi:peptidoglycan/LPS O-acetylase OafA/YrhL
MRLTFPACDAVFLGCIAAILLNQHGDRMRQSLSHRLALPVGLALFVIPAISRGISPAWCYPPWLLGLAILLLVLIVQPDSTVGNVLEWGPLHALGTISYGLYVWQGLFLRNGPLQPQLMLQRAPYNVIATFVVATLSYFLIERPALRLKSRLPDRSTIPREIPAISATRE